MWASSYARALLLVVNSNLPAALGTDRTALAVVRPGGRLGWLSRNVSARTGRDSSASTDVEHPVVARRPPFGEVEQPVDGVGQGVGASSHQQIDVQDP